MYEVKQRPGANVPEAGCKFFWRMPFFLHRANEEERKKEGKKKKEKTKTSIQCFFFTSRSKMKFFTGLDSCRNNDAQEET